jgi:hypothetical protein
MELDGRVMEFFYVVVCFAHLHKYRPISGSPNRAINPGVFYINAKG